MANLGNQAILAFGHVEVARKLANRLAPTSIFSYQDLFGAAMTILFEFDRHKRHITTEQLAGILAVGQNMSVAMGDHGLGRSVYSALDLIFGPRDRP